jgi:hypothetical protein
MHEEYEDDDLFKYSPVSLSELFEGHEDKLEVPEKTNWRESEKRQASEIITAFRELYAPSEEFIGTFQTQFHEIAAGVIDSIPDSVHREAVARHISHIELAIFSSGAMDLPDGLLIGGYTGYPSIQYDPSMPYMNEGVAGYVRSELRRHGAVEILEERYRQFETDASTVERARLITEAWTSSSVFEFFSAFESAGLLNNDAPLDVYWRTIRERQIDQTVRQRHGIRDNEVVQSGTQAHRELVRDVYRLDEETIKQPVTDIQLSGIERARQYLIPYIIESLRESSDLSDNIDEIDIQFTISEHLHSSMMSFKEASGEKRKLYIGRFLSPVARRIQELSIGDGVLKEIIQDRLRDLLHAILDPKTKSLRDALEVSRTKGVLAQAKKELRFESTPLFGNLINHPQKSFFYEFRGDSTGNNELRIAAATRNEKRYPVEDIFSNEAYVSTKSSQEERRMQTLAWRKGSSNGARLMTRQNGSIVLPDYAALPDMTVKVDENDFVPSFPGYTMVSVSPEGAYGFRYEKMNDPYVPCNIQIPEEKRLSLADEYDSVGLHNAAEQVRYLYGLTVENLVEILRRNSEYVYMSKGFHSRNIYSLETISDIVSEDGKLYVQCTGAAQVLKTSLEYAFGVGSANTISGYLSTESQQRISKLGHMQTTFKHKGKLFILDATPSGGSGRSAAAPESIGPEEKSLLRRIMARLTVAQPTDVENSVDAVEEIINMFNEAPREKVHISNIEATNQEIESPSLPKIEDISPKLKIATLEYLKVYFDLPSDEALFKHLVKLPPHDPLRRSAEVALRAAKGTISVEEIAEAAHYLAVVAKSDQRQRETVDAEMYDARSLHHVSDIMHKILETKSKTSK